MTPQPSSREMEVNRQWSITVLKGYDEQIAELKKKRARAIRDLEKETDLCSNCYKPSDRKDANGKIIHQCQSCYDYFSRMYGG